ncbi:MAG: acetyl-CoA synthetase [Thermoplasmatales archaeon]|nr:acetyl-CoA synthetase [Thermoplasmatales archaeon]
MQDFIDPKSVAIVGATDDLTKVGGLIMANMIRGGYSGKIFPINAKRETVQGFKAYPSVEDVGEHIDVAVFIVPAKYILEEIEKLGRIGTKAAIVLTAGFKEIGPEGAKLEEELVATAKKAGVRIMGPNCFGNINVFSGLNTTFNMYVPQPGNIAILSQSGAVGSSILDWGCNTPSIGMSKFMTFGNKCDIDEADCIEYLGNDDQTGVIGMYIEGMGDGMRFVKAVESMDNKKPMVVFKSGRTAAGSKAASSHTGSLAGADEVYNVIFKKLNIYRPKDLDEMFDVMTVLSLCKPMEGTGVALITNAGGLGVMSADASFSDEYIHAAELSDATKQLIIDGVPTIASAANPVDVRGDAKAEYFKEAIRAVAKDPNVAAIAVMSSPLDTADLDAVAHGIVEVSKEIDKPMVTCFAGGLKCSTAIKIAREGGLACFPSPDRELRALSALRRYYLNHEAKKTPMHIPDAKGKDAAKAILAKAKKEGRISLSESEGKKILAAYGVPTPGEAVVNTADDAVAECERIGYPVVMKILSPDIQHKTDVGGVVVGVSNAGAAKDAFYKIMTSCKAAKPEARLDGVSIQQMVSGQEVILSVVRDENFGPVVSFGLGGIFVEILKEISQAHIPLTEEMLDEMITSTKAYKLLIGARGQATSDIEALKDTVRRIILISIENPEIHELEINPVIVGTKGKGCWAVDALITLVE